MKPFLKLMGLLLMMWSCNNSGKNPTFAMPEQKEVSQNQQYTIDDLGISIEWTAYKFTDKIGVSGTFQDYTLNQVSESTSIENILSKLQLSIPTESIDTKNAIRDFKLTTYFFKVFNTSKIVGTVVNAKEGEGIIKLAMNNISVNTPYTYSLENNTLELFTHLDLRKWKGEEALSTLNQECFELHKGADGISKLWPDVDVTIRLPVDGIQN